MMNAENTKKAPAITPQPSAVQNVKTFSKMPASRTPPSLRVARRTKSLYLSQTPVAAVSRAYSENRVGFRPVTCTTSSVIRLAAFARK